MKKCLLLFFMVLIVNIKLVAQLSASAFVTPRIESEAIGANYWTPTFETKVNTYATVNGVYQHKKFFIELGFGFLRKSHETYTETGTVYLGGGSGELSTYNIFKYYSFDYSNIQSKLNLGFSFDLGKHCLLIGWGMQTEYLVTFNMNTAVSQNSSIGNPIIARPFEKPRTSAYFKVNPRFFISDNVFIEINNLFGVSAQQKSHLRKMSSYVEHNSGSKLFYEAGVGIGYKF